MNKRPPIVKPSPCVYCRHAWSKACQEMQCAQFRRWFFLNWSRLRWYYKGVELPSMEELAKARRLPDEVKDGSMGPHRRRGGRA